ncbi:TIGR04255 family protein [Marinilabilia rubra]|uniref:TIGR04255 family protein n=1 Tax=Marinilabilia rubra TaxID=2162893 RepID=A0A2U2BBF0_9BACT|nr:TIGR04255 family protein [Marinilabilia rubra]PWE00363.1 hypothetical protein DDZ16_05330 [Marinilabilia rubra]
MSKLPKAPLLEVIFEIKWDITSKTDIVDFQYLHGDLYSNLKSKYSHRENLLPPEVPLDIIKGSPVFRFREKQGSYPLVQVGPGLISLNTIDDKYFWNQFRDESNKILNILNDIYPKYSNFNLSPALTYLDFFNYDKSRETPLDFINSNFQLSLNDDFMKDTDSKMHDVNFTFNYEVEQKIVSLNLRNGKINNDKNGIVLQTKVIGKKEKYDAQKLKEWLESAHNLSSNMFKSLTAGKLYESFK